MVSEVLVLFYHRVNILDNDYNLLSVAPEHFEQQMRYLKDNFNIVGLDEKWDRLEGKNICITFDDGYLDNYEFAAPILEKYQIPATIFVATDYMNQDKEFWWDELEKWILLGGDSEEEFHLKDIRYDCNFHMNTLVQRKNTYRSLQYLIKNYIDEERKEDWLTQLSEYRKQKRETRKSYYAMSDKECKILSESKYISIGAHTKSHFSIGMRDYQFQLKEIQGSIQILSQVTNKKIDTFSYPFGGIGDFNDDSVEICKRNGIKKIVTTIPGIWKSGDDEYRIPRNVVRNWDRKEFEKNLQKYWENT